MIIFSLDNWEEWEKNPGDKRIPLLCAGEKTESEEKKKIYTLFYILQILHRNG